MAKVVDCVATPFKREKSIPPLPLKVKELVWSWAWVGKRKTREQVLPASEAGISKLKMEETVEETVPKYEVPEALFGFDESTGTMR